MSRQTLYALFSENPSSRFRDICSRILVFCNSRSLRDGICVHSPVIKLGFEDDLYLNNNLLCLYSKCCGLEQARQFFDEMPQRDVVSWTGLLSAYVKSGNHENALQLFYSMLTSGQTPNEFTLSSVLRSCSALEEFDPGSSIHTYIVKKGMESNPILGSNLIDLYYKCGYREQACNMLMHMENSDAIAWTTMISSFLEDRKWNLALHLYLRMVEAKVPPNEYTFVKLLAASSFLGLKYGMLIHAHLIMWGIQLNLILKTALVDMYSRFHMMEDAIKIFSLTPDFDVFLWTTIISGYVQSSKVREAIKAFLLMEVSGVAANNFTYSSLLTACTSILSLELGQQLHSRVILVGLDKDVSAGNALIDMYMKCSCTVENAFQVFRYIYSPNVISWTTLIAGLAAHNYLRESFQFFQEMREAGVEPNSFTLSSILRACGTTEYPTHAMQLHGFIIKSKADHDITVGNALVDAYARLELFDDAWGVLSMMDHRDTITYTTLATRMNHVGHHGMALEMIRYMVKEEVMMDEFSLACFLSASAGMNEMISGGQLHCYSVKSGLGRWISVSNALIDLYAKCQCMKDAHKTFEEIPEPNTVSWNGLISGLVSTGNISPAFSMFEDMRLSGVKPDSVTLLLVLSACSRGGLVDLGLEYFHSVKEAYEIAPELYHYNCLVNLLGQAGRLDEARDMIENMPLKQNAMIYKTLLSACRLHKNVPLGEEMARKGMGLDPFDLTFYLLLAKLYDASGRSDLGDGTRQMMRDLDLRSFPRLNQHVSSAGDRFNMQM
ncbi:hypothetical protein ACJRO7_002703 [Eucalyptus globulus]|uniref:Pentatricopeptide repeat-containing protein n=1 Tax=Eucalyptus globulus TaxID=34317 RepID=A0ABD3M0I1_EUCGL